MVFPIVTEVRRRLEALDHDPFCDEFRVSQAETPPAAREGQVQPMSSARPRP